MNRGNILIVEDDGELAAIMVEVLSEEGYRVQSARDGLEALSVAEHEPPDLIILDLMMPVMDGWQFREQQQKLPALASIPVVLTTADGHAFKKAKTLRVDGCLPKPVALDRLLAEIARVLPPSA